MTATSPRPSGSLAQALFTQMRVVGALLMREMHTRYGRDNIGYMWLVLEPMLLAGVVASFHISGHTNYGSDIKPLPFTVLGYTVFIIFRNVVNRAEGAIEVNAPLLYHRMVTVFDIVIARALLEAAGCTLAYLSLMVLLIGLGVAEPPARPLLLIASMLLMLWFATGLGMIVTGISHDNRTVGRLVHPFTYFMLPLSGAFYQVEWISEPYRSYLLYLPLPHIFELARYGQFRSANLDYLDIEYLLMSCLVLSWIGLVCIRLMKRRIHLS